MMNSADNRSNNEREQVTSVGDVSKYTVINDKLIRDCIKLKKVDDLFHDDKKLPTNDIKREKMDFNQIEYLKFSAKSTSLA